MLDKYKNFYSKLENHFQTKPKEIIHLTKALGRVTASDIKAKKTLPERDKAYITGYAFASSLITSYPVTLEIIENNENLNLDNLTGKAIKINEGDDTPQNIDSIIPEGEITLNKNFITIEQPILHGENIYYQGIEFCKKDTIIKKGHILRPRDLGLSSAMKNSWIPVIQKPNIAVLTIDSNFNKSDVYEDKSNIMSSAIIINGEITSFEANPVNLGICSGTLEELSKTISEIASSVDLLVTIGEITPYLSKIIEENIKEKKYKVNINITKEETIYFIEEKGLSILTLPNNPVSVQICSSLFLPNIIKKLYGVENENENSYYTLGRNLDINDIKADFIAAQIIEKDNKSLQVIPVSSYDRILMSSLKNSDCAIVVDKNKTNENDFVEVIKFNKPILNN